MIVSEQQLWRAVIGQVFLDLQSAQKAVQRRAIAWATGRTEDRDIVCGLADVSPHEVEKQARAIYTGKRIWPTEKIKAH